MAKQKPVEIKKDIGRLFSLRLYAADEKNIEKIRKATDVQMPVQLAIRHALRKTAESLED